MGHMATYLVEMSSKSDFKSIAQQPDIILPVRTEILKEVLLIFLQEQYNITTSCRSVACWRGFGGLPALQNLVHKKQFMSWDSL